MHSRPPLVVDGGALLIRHGSGRLSFQVTIPPCIPIGTLATMQSGIIYTSDASSRLSNPTTIFVQ
ncbi:MAG: hypothetical protein ACJAZ8_000375 [Planctomycetota bacterium]|jgi:hypothetical protein